jgi:hypothetical protein
MPEELEDLDPEFLEKFVRIYLAGNVGSRRALRGSAPGWRRTRGEAELRAFHESSHAVIGHLHGHYPWLVSIKLDPGVRIEKTGISGGFSAGGNTPSPPPGWARPSGRAETDLRRAAKACLVLSNFEGPYGWKSALRHAHRLKSQTARLVDAYWPYVVTLAGKLAERGELTGAEVMAILKARGT